MFDTRLRPLIDRPLNQLGPLAVRLGVSANQITVAGFGFGMVAFVAIAAGHTGIGLGFVLLNRLMDGLDGAVARASQKTDLGGYLDIVLDFAFYGAVPLAFAWLNPEANALSAAFLLFSFYVNGASFLAFAVMAQKRGLQTDRQGVKSLYYLGGLAEGGETIFFFCLMCLWPSGFALLATGFALLCLVSATARIAQTTLLLQSQE